MRMVGIAMLAVAIFISAYVVRGPDLLGDYENGGLRDWATTVALYGALAVLMATAFAAAVHAFKRRG